MKLLRPVPTRIQTSLNRDTDPINKARTHILFYMMSITVIFCAVLFFNYLISGPPFQLIRTTLIILTLSYGMYHLLRTGNYKPAAHIVILILLFLVWSNIFIIIQAINIVTIQYVILTITCSFYLLDGKRGIVFSTLVLIPVALNILINGASNIQISISAQQASDPIFVFVLLFNFFLIVFINYHFLKAFQLTIDRLKESQRDEKQLNEKLKDAIFIAESSSRSKSDFLSTISHELRTPLNSVIGMSYVLLADSPRADQEDNLKVLHFSAESLLSLINDILDFNKLEYGKIQLESIVFNPSELITSIHSGLKHQAKEKGLVFVLQLDERLQNIGLKGDPTRLLQILFNLVGNAIKFTPEGRVLLSVDISELTDQSVNLNFRVEDTGIGVSAEHLDIIFEPFSQASNSITRQFGGTGLGLAITKQLLELHESQMSIESEPGNGTIFKFSIKYHTAAQVRSAQDRSSDHSHSAHTGFAELNILVAEDNAMNVLLMRKLFASWKIKADFAVNGAEAVRKACDKAYDIILMDIHMPVMDGCEASRQILDFYSFGKNKPHIIALTASMGNDILQRINEAGLEDYISKPFNPADLRNKIAQIHEEILKSA